MSGAEAPLDLPPAAPAPRPARPWRVVAGVAVAFAAIGMLALQIAVPPTYASPVFPSTGLALAAVLAYGRTALGGVFLGTFVLMAGQRGVMGDAWVTTALVATLTALGTTLQAWLGAALLRRHLGAPLTLDTPAEFLRFALLGGILACLVSATIAATTFVAFHIIAAGDWFATWWVWWSGDAVGVVIGMPIALCVIGTPREVWRPRLRGVGLPLALAALLVGVAIATLGRLESKRIDAEFHQDALSLANLLEQRLAAYTSALHATHGLFIASDDVTPDEFRAATDHWLRTLPGLRAIGWSTRLTPDEVAAHERSMRARGFAGYAVFDRGPQDERLPPLTAGELMAITYIEPRATNELAQGVNTMSVPEPRAAMLRAMATGEVVATGGFRLIQDRDPRLGVVVYRAVALAGDPPGTARGVAFVTMRLQHEVETLAGVSAHGLAVCVRDLTSGAPHRLLGGPALCDQRGAHAQIFEKPLAFAQRQWQVRVAAPPEYFAQRHSWAAWSFSVTAVIVIALLGAYLLAVAGRTRRIESSVALRTAELSHEIGERRATEVALRASEERLRTVFDAAPVGLSIAALDGSFMRTNPQYCAMVGRTLDELESLRISDVTFPEDRAADRRAHAALIAGHTSVVTVEKRYLRPDGSILPAEVVITVERDARGTPRALIGVATDITERQHLRDAQQAQRIAEASSHAKTEFLSRMSHELRTPLNAILGFAQLVELDTQAPLTSSQRERMQLIQASGWHLLEMINDVLDLSLIESGGMRLGADPIDLDAVVRDALAMVRHAADQRGITLVVTRGPSLPSASGDATRLRQVLVNLLTNAIKYNRERGEVRIATHQEADGRLAVRVSDTGIGFTAAQLEQLFQPFNRLGREHGAVEGAGIGLVIARRLVELMGGSLDVESHGGAGTTFTCRLPAAIRPSPVRPAAGGPHGHETPAAHADSAAPVQTARVLYIEDNLANGEVMRGFLQMRPGVALEVRTTMAEGLAALRARPPDILLLDMNLPDGTGMEVLRAVRDDPRLAAIPVVIVSADAMASQVDAALQAGADSYLAKPLRMNEVLLHIDDALELKARRAGAATPLGTSRAPV